MPGTDKFTCDGCQREMTWKKEFAGRRIKCKNCGQPMVIPDRPNQPEPEPVGDDDLYALSDMVADAKQAAAALPPTVVEAAAMAIPAAVPAGGAPASKPKASKSGIPLAYQRQMTPAEKQSAAAISHVDKNREVYVPLIMLVVGATLYIGYYAFHYQMGIGGIIGTGIGLAIMTVFETIVLFCFALAIAGPLGVSFGGIGTALLKFASIIVLCDGVTTWIENLIFGNGGFGGSSILGFGAVGFPIALGIYWATLIYLFAMDPGDSWMVVVILSIFYRIFRILIVVLLLKLILSGIGGISVPVPGGGGGGAVSEETQAVIDEVDQAKRQNVLHEARKYAADYGRKAEASFIEDWYNAGAVNVWYQTDRDINGKGDAFQFVIELPKDSASRTKVYNATKKYFDGFGHTYASQGLKDDGAPYLIVELP